MAFGIRTIIRLLAFMLLAIWTIAAVAPVEDYFPKPDSAGGWRMLKDASAIRKIAGMDMKKLDQAFEYASRSSQHGGLLLVRHGWLVYERYYGRGHREAIPATASVGKAYTSIACGIMLAEKRALIPDGLDTKVFNDNYLPEALPLEDPAKADITLGQLLSMSAGLHGEGSNPGFVDGVPAVKLTPLERPATPIGQDLTALRTPLWTKPGGVDLSKEPQHVLDLYGIGEKPTDEFGRQLLMARRLVENGVRFVQLCHAGGGNGSWDAHGDMKTHEPLCRAVDKPIAGLIKDLKQRGMLQRTLVVFTSEFGRSPWSQNTTGRDHNPKGYSSWFAGGGIKGGTVHGATDEFGYTAVENPHYYSDLHATILKLLGLDHKKMNFRTLGRTFHLVEDDYGPIEQIIA